MIGCEVRPELDQEWLLSNGLGGFAMGTACGAPTRRYHGLLIGAASPPVDRVVALHSTIDTLTLPGSGEISLSTMLFGEDASPHPDGWTRLLSFECDLQEAIWRWSLPTGITISKRLSLKYGFNACSIRWRVEGLPDTAILRVRPLVLLRDFHSLQSRPTDEIALKKAGRTLRVHRGDIALVLRAARGAWMGDSQWWEDIEYPVERERGYDHRECALAASMIEIPLSTSLPGFELTAEMDSFVPMAPPQAHHELRPIDTRLAEAANQFIVAREGSSPGKVGVSIIAGYPWFADWGRDAMISVHGLLVTTGRLDEARAVLETFANAAQDGLIPNRFDDRDPAVAHYNTADASLWFLQALHAWIEAAGGPHAPGAADLICVAMDVIDAHVERRCTGVWMDEDGLIEAGIGGEALTWMDARINGAAVTPRIGKPVELSALWHSGLRLLATHVTPADHDRLCGLASRTARSFGAFWNVDLNCCFDLLRRTQDGWIGEPQIRPNQIFAVSLPNSPLTAMRQRHVVEMVREHLVTPYGLRTLSPSDPDYRGRFEGTMDHRDTAYHNGTVWPWLIGPWCDALRVVAQTSAAASQATQQAIAPLLDSLNHGCIGQVAEIYDGDAPHHPHGCPAQAWSTAELLRTCSSDVTAGHFMSLQ